MSGKEEKKKVKDNSTTKKKNKIKYISQKTQIKKEFVKYLVSPTLMFPLLN